MENRRIVIAVIVSCILFLNQMAFATLSSATITPYMPSIFFFILFFNSMNWTNKEGLYRTIMFALALQTFGIMFAKIGGANDRIAGAILNGASLTYYYNCFVTVSSTWFGIRGRILVTGLFIFSMNLGNFAAQWNA